MEHTDDTQKLKGDEKNKAKINIWEVVWDYSNIEEWRRDLNEIEKLNLTSQENLHRFGIFYGKTLDKIAMPIEESQEVNESLFEIQYLLSKKVTNKNVFRGIQRYINALKSNPKYDIALQSGNPHLDTFNQQVLTQ